VRRFILCLALSTGCTDPPPAIELAPLPSELGCADDADGDPANGLQFSASVVAIGDLASYDRFEIENYTTDRIVEVALAGGGEGLVTFALSHNGVVAWAIDEDGGAPPLSSNPSFVLACCNATCR
jgi:hypothetical protein